MARVLITGSNRGIGLELCRAYADRGDTVVGVCRRASPALQALDLEILEPVDVADDGSVAALAEAVSGRTLDILILNAGILTRETFDDLDFERMRREYEVNSLGPLRLVRALRENLVPGSRIAIITSRVGSIGDNGSGGNYGYRMSKAAVNMAGVNLAHDLRPRGIPVQLLHPGLVATDMTHGTGMPPSESAGMLIRRIDEICLETSGTFRHANGEPLPW